MKRQIAMGVSSALKDKNVDFYAFELLMKYSCGISKTHKIFTRNVKKANDLNPTVDS